MANQVSSPLGGLTLTSVANDDITITEDEIRDGVTDASAELINFKVEQKISNAEGNTKLNIGGFVNANSKYKKLETRYLATLLSNKTQHLKDPNGNIIATKRYGIGFGLSLKVSDIETKVNANFGVLAASSKLDFAKIQYELGVYGAVDPTIIGQLPSTSGDFSAKAFDELAEFINKAKKTLKDSNPKLYPIEFIKEQELALERSDIRSIYFGVRQVSLGNSLMDAVINSRKLEEDFNENVIQFMYRYFGLSDAYARPTETQRFNAGNWQKGAFSKISDTGVEGSWVNIDANFTGDIGDPVKNYKPHALPQDWATLGKELKDEFSETSAEFSSDLKISAVADVSAGFNSVVLTRDIAWFIDTSDNAPANSQVIETRYGVGVRLMIKLSNIEFGTEVNFGAVGAISELNLANVEYEISGIGFADKTLLDVLPGPQNITQNTVDDLIKTFESVKDKLSNTNVDQLSPQAYKIRVLEPDKIDPTLEAQATVYATRKIRDKVRLNACLQKAAPLGLDEQVIKRVYKDYGVNGNEGITNQQRNEARDWIGFQ